MVKGRFQIFEHFSSLLFLGQKTGLWRKLHSPGIDISALAKAHGALQPSQLFSVLLPERFIGLAPHVAPSAPVNEFLQSYIRA
jgi:hypothetical protein